MYVIYCYTNTTNGMQYIGQTNNLKRRDNAHRNDKRNNYFDNHLQKHPEDFKLEILRCFHDISQEALDEWEIYFIAKLNTKKPNGYNLTDGGNGSRGYKHTEETKQKMSEAKKDIKFTEEHKQKISKAMKGKKITEETRKKMSLNNARYMLGKHHTEESKKKISLNNTRYMLGKHHIEETIQKNRINQPNRKPVRCIELNMTFESSQLAAVWLRENGWPKADGTKIRKCCRGEASKAYGYHWEYFNEED